MAATYTVIVRGVKFSMTAGAGNTDGVAIHPDNVSGISDNELLMAMKQALSMYPDFVSYAYVDEHVVCGAYTLQYMSDAPSGYVTDLRAICEKALNQTSFLVSDDWKAKVLTFISGLDEIAQGKRFVTQKKNTKRMSAGYVYLIRAVEPQSHYKIGLSKTPVKRIESLNVHLPYPIEVLHLIKTDDMHGLEASLHSKYADKRVNGEWFALSQDDVSEICSMKEIE